MMSPLLAAVLGEYSLTDVPSRAQLEQMTDAEQFDLHERLRQVVVQFRDRAHSEVDTLRGRIDELQQQVIDTPEAPAPAPIPPPVRPLCRIGAASVASLQTGPLTVLRPRPVRVPRPGVLDRRLVEIDREILAISRRYRMLVCGWKTSPP